LWRGFEANHNLIIAGLLHYKDTVGAVGDIHRVGLHYFARQNGRAEIENIRVLK